MDRREPSDPVFLARSQMEDHGEHVRDRELRAMSGSDGGSVEVSAAEADAPRRERASRERADSSGTLGYAQYRGVPSCTVCSYATARLRVAGDSP
jgi:hypothetical protein